MLFVSEVTMTQGWIVDDENEDVEINIKDVREFYKKKIVSKDEEKKDVVDFVSESNTNKVLEKYKD